MLSPEEYASTIAFLNQHDAQSAHELGVIQMQDTILYDIKPAWHKSTNEFLGMTNVETRLQLAFDMFKNLRMLVEKFRTLYNLSEDDVLLEVHASLFYPIDDNTHKMVDTVINDAYKAFKCSVGEDDSVKHGDKLSCRIVKMFNEFCFEVAPLSLTFVERLFGDLPMELVKETTKIRVQNVFLEEGAQPYHTKSFMRDLEKWLNRTACDFLSKVYGSFDEGLFLKQEEIKLFMYEVYGKGIIDRLLFISLHYPSCHNIITDLIICMEKVPLRKIAIKTLSKKVKAELLHQGVSSTQILTAYIHFVKCLRVVDPTGVFVDSVCHPIRQYLRQRSDTVRCIVSFLTDSEFSRLNLKQELEKDEYDEEYMDENIYSWMTWKPDPIDADPTRTRRSRNSADLLTMLVSVYGSKQLFVKEYAQLLADRLLKNADFESRTEPTSSMVNLERQCLTLLKKRFGEADLLQCEVMLKDIAESAQLHSSIVMSSDYVGTLKRSLNKTPKDLKLNCCICSTHFWPKMKGDKLEVPSEVQVMQEAYKKGYENLKSNRSLEFYPTQGFVNIELDIGGQTRPFTVSPLIASVLMCFTSKDVWTIDELSAHLSMSSSHLKHKIGAWAAKSGLLVEKPAHSGSWSVPHVFPPPSFGHNTDTTFNKLANHLSQAGSSTQEPMNVEESDESSGEESEDDGTENVIEEQLEMRWKYIQQLLRTCQTLAAERLLSLFPDVKTLTNHVWDHHLQRLLPEHQSPEMQKRLYGEVVVPSAPIFNNSSDTTITHVDAGNDEQETGGDNGDNQSIQMESESTSDHRLVDYSDSDSEPEHDLPTSGTQSNNVNVSRQEHTNDPDYTSSEDDDDDDDPMQHNQKMPVPVAAQLGPTDRAFRIVDNVQNALEYDEYNEVFNEVPAVVYQQVAGQIPTDAQPHINNNWKYIRSFIHDGPIAAEYNRRTVGNEQKETLATYFRQQVHSGQHTAYKVHAAPGFVLENVETGEYRFFDARRNGHGIEVPPVGEDGSEDSYIDNFLIKDDATLNHFLKHINYKSIEKSAKRPNTKWRMLCITNVHFWITKVNLMPIGCGECDLPDYMMRNGGLETFVHNKHGHRYNDHLCVFRIITYKLDNEVVTTEKVKQRFDKWCATQSDLEDQQIKTFKGIALFKLHTVEDLFNVSFNVYTLQRDGTAHRIRLAPQHPDRVVINVDMYQFPKNNQAHFSLITNLHKYTNKYFCNFCNMRFAQASNLHRHETMNRCTRGQSKKSFPGGVHQEVANIFERIERLGIAIPENQPRYNQFYANYDFESILIPVQVDDSDNKLKPNPDPHIVRPHTDGDSEWTVFEKHKLPTKHLPAVHDPSGTMKRDPMARKQQFFQVHQPISFSIFSNVPGYDDQPYTVIESDTEKLIEKFLDYLEKIAECRLTILNQDYSEPITKLEELAGKLEEEIVRKKEDKENYNLQSNYLRQVQMVKSSFEKWLNQLPVIGFNSGKYDLPLIKDYLYPSLVKRAYEHVPPSVIFDYDQLMAKKLGITCQTGGGKKVKKIGGSKGRDEEVDECDLGEEDGGCVDETNTSNNPCNFFFNTEQYIAKHEKQQSRDTMKKKNDVERENRPPPIKGLPQVTKRGRKILCIRTDTLQFLDFSLYLAAGTSLDKFQKIWMKADAIRAKQGLPEDRFKNIELNKLPFPYSFLDSVKKLDYEGVPPYEDFFSHLRGKNITLEEYDTVKKVYEKHGIVKLRDYLKLYNEIDVKPFLQAISKQFTQFYDQTGVDIFKECISLPGLTLKFLYKKTAGYQFALWRPEDEEIQAELRKDMTGGLSLVMTRLAVAGETIIRADELQLGKHPRNQFHTVKNIHGYDANALYLYAHSQDMPSGFPSIWIHNDVTGKMVKKRDAKPSATDWLQYKSHEIGAEIIHKYTHGFEERVGLIHFPVDGYCPETNTVYEFLGCYWHTHGSHRCKCAFPIDTNASTGKTWQQCATELRERKQYVELLNKKFECIWECEWNERKKREPEIVKYLKGEQRKYAFHTSISTKKVMKGIENGDIFGFCQVDMETPEVLRQLHCFKDYPPIIKNVMLSKEHLSPSMREHCENNGQWKQPRRSLISTFTAKKQWFLTSMVEYLMKKGLKLTKVHKIVQFDRKRPFEWFAKEVTMARSAADKDTAFEMLGQLYKLIGNCAYGKTITDIGRHTDVYIVPYELAREIANDPFMVSVEPIRNTDYYEVVLRKRKIIYKLPEQIGMAVYNWAKIRMFQFAYDFLGKFCDPYKYSWCQTDTDSSYIMLAGDNIEDIVLPHMQKRFEAEKQQWLVLTDDDKRTPGLFKLEYSGHKMICLSSKTYQVVGHDGDFKSATKGINKTSQFQFDEFRKVLETGTSVKGFNTGFQTKDKQICTYICEREALTFVYGKRSTHKDGIHTDALDI